MSDGLSVRGGVGGTTARLEDLYHAGSLLCVAAAELAKIAATTTMIAADPALLASGVLAPVSWAVVEVHLGQAVLGPDGAGTLAAELGQTGGAVLAAAAAYQGVEVSLRWTTSELERAVGEAAGAALQPVVRPFLVAALLVEVTVASASNSHNPRLPSAQGGDASSKPGWAGVLAGAGLGLLARHSDQVEVVIAAAPGLVTGMSDAVPGAGQGWSAVAGAGWPPRDSADLARLASGLGAVSPMLHDRGEVAVVRGDGIRVPPPAGLGDLVDGVAACYPTAGAVPGTVRVQSVVGRDGARAWIVDIPGTQEWSPIAGAQPFDLTSDVRLMAGQKDAASHMVIAAMRVAGVPAGEQVLLAGHSQGGMVAASLAADPTFRGEFHVTHVVTLGSPVALYQVPPSVHVLSLEHDDDLVPRLDGSPNPDRSGWLTVSRAAMPGAGLFGAGLPDVTVTHDARTYVQTARIVEASHDPGIAHWRSELTPFTARPGATSTVVSVVGVRLSAP